MYPPFQEQCTLWTSCSMVSVRKKYNNFHLRSALDKYTTRKHTDQHFI